MANSKDAPLLAELVAIKRLLAYSLLKSGASQREVAAALGVDQSSISRMFPKGSTGGASRIGKGN